MDEARQPRLTLAERLLNGRAAKGVSPEVASEQACVPIRYVRMFEAGNYPVVADPAYLVHFVRRYAGYLGLDAETASRDLIAETEPETARRRTGKLAPGTSERKPSRTLRARFESPLLGAPGGVEGGMFPPLRGGWGGRRFGTYAAPLVVALVAAAVGLFVFFWSDRSAAPQRSSDAAPPPAPPR